MTPHNKYRVTMKIKLHTSPLRLLEYHIDGVFLKETTSYFVFDDFRVRKANVINIVPLEED